MNKHTGEKRTPEAIAKELENIDFAEIEEADLREVFGHGIDLLAADCNCPPPENAAGCGMNVVAGCGGGDGES